MRLAKPANRARPTWNFGCPSISCAATLPPKPPIKEATGYEIPKVNGAKAAPLALPANAIDTSAPMPLTVSPTEASKVSTSSSSGTFSLICSSIWELEANKSGAGPTSLYLFSSVIFIQRILIVCQRE